MAIRSVKTAAVGSVKANPGDVIYDNQTTLSYFVVQDGARICLNDLMTGNIPRAAGPAGRDGQSIVGPQGDKGERGEKGEQGERGETGPRGVTGADGKDGLPGEKGDTGAAGRDGVVYHDLQPEHLALVQEIKFKLDALLDQNQKGQQYIEWLKAQLAARAK